MEISRTLFFSDFSNHSCKFNGLSGQFIFSNSELSQILHFSFICSLFKV